MAASVASLAKQNRGVGMGMEDEDEGGNVGPVIYVSGEENSWQVASRAARLGIQEPELLLLCDTDADLIADMIANPKEGERYPSLVVIDSIQTMLCESGGASSPGGVTQVRETVGLFLRLSKATGIPIIMIGHMTKSGDVAGPRTVEHMVDTVLYLEGDNTGSNANIRMLRASKNRFGSADEVGVYQIKGSGVNGGAFIPVSDPSSFFLSTRMDDADSEGCAVSLVLEGSRCLAAEVQALVSHTSGINSSPGRRTVDGVAMSRVLLILAVLDKRYGIRFSRQDVYVNVVGGIRLSSSVYQRGDRSGSDLAVAVALASSLAAIPVRSDTAFVGEIGLVGELRPVPSIEKRVAEAKRMGFSRVVTPKKYRKGNIKTESFASKSMVGGIEVVECDNVLDAINAGLVARINPERRKRRMGQVKKQHGSSIDDSAEAKENPWLDIGDLLIVDDENDDSKGFQ